MSKTDAILFSGLGSSGRTFLLTGLLESDSVTPIPPPNVVEISGRVVIPPLYHKIIRVFGNLRFRLPLQYQYNRALALAQRIYCLMTCQDESYSYSFTLSPSRVIIRTADPQAKSTTVNNLGPGIIQVWDKGSVVAVIQPTESKTLPLTGQYLIEAAVIDGTTASASITTVRKCDCGEPHIDVPAQYGSVSAIGEDLI